MLDKQPSSSFTNKYRIGTEKSRKNIIKTNKELPSLHIIKDKSQKIKPSEYQPHFAQKYIYGTLAPFNDFKKFVNLLYQGLFYSVCSLRGPSEEFIRKKSVKLPERKDGKSKFLMLDLDETLIHSVWGSEVGEVTLNKGDQSIRLNIRPHCLSFLQKMSQHYQIYIFTASTQDYAKTIVDHLNQKKKTIQGILSRSNCLQTQNGLRIKDLRIIKNRNLQDIIIIDNLVHSFGLQLDNGIPILEYTNNKEDKELLGIQRILLELKGVADVREYLNRRLALKKCLEMNENEFCNISGKKGRKA